MTLSRKPRVFIGSSREAIPFARAVCSMLEYNAEVNPWFAGVFKNLHSLDKYGRPLLLLQRRLLLLHSYQTS